jgi:hypothetical protein
MARRTVTDQALPDGVYPYAIGSGDDKQQQRYYAKLANGATKRGFTTARGVALQEGQGLRAQHPQADARHAQGAVARVPARAAALRRAGHVRGL